MYHALGRSLYSTIPVSSSQHSLYLVHLFSLLFTLVLPLSSRLYFESNRTSNKCEKVVRYRIFAPPYPDFALQTPPAFSCIDLPRSFNLENTFHAKGSRNHVLLVQSAANEFWPNRFASKLSSCLWFTILDAVRRSAFGALLVFFG